MSHQTGIVASEALHDVLRCAKEGDIRSLKIIIANEKLELGDKKKVVGQFEQDYDCCINDHLKDESCCYILVRCDEKSNTNEYHWLLILFTPDNASVKDKMLYAATKASLKNIFGDELIIHEIHGTGKEDVNYKGFNAHIISQNAAPPLTMTEKHYVEMKKTEVHRSIMDRADTLPGISFPIDAQVIESFEKLAAGSINYAQLIVDANNERIKLDCVKTCSINELSCIKKNEPRYHFIRYKYTHESQNMSAIIFVYTMPGYTCSVKDRMMYSSCKGPLVNYFENKYSPIDKKIEEEDLSHINEKYLYEELHPPVMAQRETFAKPKRPGRR